MKRLMAIGACVMMAVTGAAVVAGDHPSSGKAPPTAPAAKPMDIVDTAVGAGQFKTLAAALQAAGLVEALKGKGPFTVFAPTDEAFAKLPAGTLENLLKPENKETLTKILTFHVIPGEVKAAQVVKMTESSATLAGQTFRIVTNDGKVSIGNDKAMANVVKTDIVASNGVIHVIDSVILPN
ncbi:MAG TPA: Nex18 symbiotically induced protein [Phycisphaerales bacterium]|nr:Nex18 symbiotically induced protein [Phycisphaerales bacterium]